jgi:hypothetical protein
MIFYLYYLEDVLYVLQYFDWTRTISIGELKIGLAYTTVVRGITKFPVESRKETLEVLQRTLFLDGYNINQLCNPYHVIYQNVACFKWKKCMW